MPRLAASHFGYDLSMDQVESLFTHQTINSAVAGLGVLLSGFNAWKQHRDRMRMDIRLAASTDGDTPVLHVTALNRGAIPLTPELCTVTFGHKHPPEALPRTTTFAFNPTGEPLQQGFSRQQAFSFLNEQFPIVEVWVSDQFKTRWVTDKVDVVNSIFERRWAR